MGEKLYSDPRWWDNPAPKSSACRNCKFYQGSLKCEKYAQKIPIDVLNKSFLGTKQFDENYCSHRVMKNRS